MFCGHSCRRFAWSRRLSLHSANAGKTNRKEESKESFSHGGERKKPLDYSQRISNEHTHFLRRKTANDSNFGPSSARNSGGFHRAKNLKVAGARALERGVGLRYSRAGMLDTILGCLKWAAIGFIVAFALMKLFEASHIHDDIPKPAFKIRQTKRATFVLSTFAAMLSALVWLLVQKLD